MTGCSRLPTQDLAKPNIIMDTINTVSPSGPSSPTPSTSDEEAEVSILGLLLVRTGLATGWLLSVAYTISITIYIYYY